MPLYEYQCKKCGRFETLQKVSDPPLQSCPTCGKAVGRLISAPAFQFKGSGWYVTDYARAGSSDSKDKSKGGEAAGTSSPPSSESKAETGSLPKESAGSGSKEKAKKAASSSATGSVPK